MDTTPASDYYITFTLGDETQVRSTTVEIQKLDRPMVKLIRAYVNDIFDVKGEERERTLILSFYKLES